MSIESTDSNDALLAIYVPQETVLELQAMAAVLGIKPGEVAVAALTKYRENLVGLPGHAELFAIRLEEIRQSEQQAATIIDQETPSPNIFRLIVLGGKNDQQG